MNLQSFFMTVLIVISSIAIPVTSDTLEQVSKRLPIDDTHEVIIEESNPGRLMINYEVKNNDVFVECLVANFSFNKATKGSLKKDGEGHIQLFINDQQVDTIYQPSFIIKSLPIGTYRIRIELVHNDDTPYGINQEFEVKM